MNELRTELESSREEAARAVKVAEQAIQSAESCSANDWSSTVTHKAAEAAAQAQRRSAEALSRQRVAEERLTEEIKSATLWKDRARIAEEKAGECMTQSAIAEVRCTVMEDELKREKVKCMDLKRDWKTDLILVEKVQKEELAAALEKNHLLEIELDCIRKDMQVKDEEIKSIHHTSVIDA